MASRLLRVCGALRRLPAPRRPPGPGPARALAAAAGGIPSDEEQATGLERKIMEAMKKGQDPYNVLPPKRYGGTKEDPHLVPSGFDKRLVACSCEEDSSCVTWFWVHKGGQLHRCPSCGAHYKHVPLQVPA
ncbi:cytochrome c oxidase subunit 5B, mitochondrial [Emydura macquarii macquarii]|uniref:cytochrome c oxidase subunit 5B, mitochondrial n=1 Tax=Emydura macquarii macquarii TaxID=1129001 RepID=UPI00352AFDC7